MVHVDSMKNGFLVIPFKLPEHPVLSKHENGKSVPCHYMFMKKHQSKQEEESNCIFLVNIPLLTNVESMKTVIKEICDKYDEVSYVEDLLYNDEFGLNDVNLSSLTSDLMSVPNDSSETRFTPRNTALLKFVDQSSVNNCWNALVKYSNIKDSSKFVNWNYSAPSFSTFINFYKPIDLEYLKDDVHSHLAIFEQREQEAQEEVQGSIVDEDGFTMVVGKNTKNLNSIRKKILKKNPLTKHEAKTKPVTMADKKAKKDFYRFQVRERKKQEINQLLNKFKEDQERIKVMKAKKKFNPYRSA
ncbi:ribosomal RNA-processing protein 7 [Monosporozyma unispora]